MSNHSDQPKQRWKRRRANRAASIKKRVVRVALIPSVALILLWLTAALYLGGTGFYDQQVASGVRQVSIPAVSGLASIEKERQLSMAYLAQPSVGLQPLLAQQKLSDQGMAAMQTAAGPVLTHAPQSIVDRMGTLTGYLGQLPDLRGRIDAGVATTAEVSAFYNTLLDAAGDLFGTQARVVPDASVVPGAIAATSVFHISDLMSRAGSLISGALASGQLSQADYLQFTSLVGAYHALLDVTVPDLRPGVQARYRNLTTTTAWKGLTAAENALIQHGAWPDGAHSDLPVTSGSWQELTNTVSGALADITAAQADEVSQQALSDGDSQLLQLAIALVVSLLVVVGSIWWARRQARVLVATAVLTRLGTMMSDARQLIDVWWAEMGSRLRAGQVVDIENEMPQLRTGEGDEIDQVATAISGALRQAVTAAAGEAQARNALNTVFRGIARRNQGPLSNLLSLLDKYEHAEQDPASLERLYQLDHEATRARRNSENLIILSGGDLGHHQPGPVRVLDVLRAAFSETRQYQRVKLKQTPPEASITSDAATALIHLIAELLENATSFSEPPHEVQVRCSFVQAGLIVEVEDRGLGIMAERRDRVNTMLDNPPEVDIMAIGDGSQLGFWVMASLIKRFGFKVALRESDYGGIHAIVRIPKHLVVFDADGGPGAGQRFEDVSDEFRPAGLRTRALTTTVNNATSIIPRLSVPVGAERNGAGYGEVAGRARRFSSAGGDVVAPAGSGTRHAGVDERSGGIHRSQRVGGDMPLEWPSTEADEPALPPLPSRSPGESLNPRLVDEDSQDDPPVDDGAGDSARDVGTALSAFQQGSEAGRRVSDL